MDGVIATNSQALHKGLNQRPMAWDRGHERLVVSAVRHPAQR